MRTETTGNAFQMRRLGERDVDAILVLCEGNRLFYQSHPPMATRESILADMTALPPGKGMEDKAYVGFFEGEKLVAVLDWISGYPAKETAWIGLFMVSAEKQGKGVGSGIIRDMAASLKAVGYREMQLGVDKGNPQSLAFWTKNGFEVLREDGYIVTNYHVINGASSVKVTLYNGDTYDATVIGGDSDYDVAVLKINAAGLTPVTLGNSADVNVGDSVLAIGNPLGELTFSMSGGYVSSCNRAINVDGTPFNMIQVDCSINPGNSGGPLMNLYGEVVGIVSAKYSTYSSTTVEGLGFAIPIDDVKSIITDIMENGAVTGKAYMAVTVGTMNSQMAAQYSIDIDQGVFVYSVVKGGAGDKAGLRLGDVITKMGDTTLTSRQDLSAALKSYRAGDTATLTVFRDGSYITTDITFDQQPQITGTDTEEDTSSQGGNNGGYSGQIPENWQEFYNYFFGNRG